MRRSSFFVVLMLVLAPMLIVGAGRARIAPQIPGADRTTGRVFLERAEQLRKATADSFMVVVGNVVFTRGPMIMRCDSAHYFPDTESLDAFGNVSMEQGDTLFVYADELAYDGPAQVATLYANPGKKVRLINRDVTLETDIFVYDLGIDLGYYEVGGRLFDKSNVLTSLKGEYIPSTKEANFYTDVHLLSEGEDDTLNIWSDTLYYNTATHIAELNSPSRVVNRRATIFTVNGIYETDSDRTQLYDRSLIVTPEGRSLVADTIYYDRRTGIGEAFGNMILSDSAHKASVYGDYGFYNELMDSSFVTGRAALSVVQGGDNEDTLWAHGRYIQTMRVFDSIHVEEDTIAGTAAYTRIDTSHVALMYPRVRFYRSDMQGVCDSMRFTERDSTLRMYRHPVVWNEERQVFGNVIELLLNDSTIERATLPDKAFTAQLIEGEHYNQMSGNEMIAHFEDGSMRRLNINGTVEIIMYPEESDSTINKMVNAQSSYLEAYFKGQTTERIKMWPETTGVATPLFLARKANYYLPKFKWYEGIRPLSKEDIFVIPDEMEVLMASPDVK
ncbi:MAG: hypothetical protein K2L96_08300 [Muribaculaceae bacterium]|nr:hypothetical protein [Muribaculaceae bacterium]